MPKPSRVPAPQGGTINRDIRHSDYTLAQRSVVCIPRRQGASAQFRRSLRALNGLPVRALLISGFLGSGKTTLLFDAARRLASDSQTVAVIENEVGEVGVHGYLSMEYLSVQELFGGCVCCTLADDVNKTIGRIEAPRQPYWVIVEPTGLARPSEVSTLVKRRPAAQDPRVLTLVDAERREVLTKTVTPLISAQIEAAHVIAVIKADLVEADALERVTTEDASINGKARIVAVSANRGKNVEVPLNAVVLRNPEEP